MLSSRRLNIIVFGILVALGVATGCSGEPDPTTARGAYTLFQKALSAGDTAALWKRCDQRTHQYFEARYQDLVAMDRKIERYLPRTDHKLARKDAGTVLLEQVGSGRELFERVVRPAQIVVDRPKELGAEIREIRMSEDESRAVIETMAGQTFRVVRADDGRWRVALVDSVPAVERSFKWLANNRDALEETVNELIADEKAEREQVIAELFPVGDKQDEPRDE